MNIKYTLLVGSSETVAYVCESVDLRTGKYEQELVRRCRSARKNHPNTSGLRRIEGRLSERRQITTSVLVAAVT